VLSLTLSRARNAPSAAPRAFHVIDPRAATPHNTPPAQDSDSRPDPAVCRLPRAACAWGGSHALTTLQGAVLRAQGPLHSS
jgi:hypothetical protein